jgi:hypothetical protein
MKTLTNCTNKYQSIVLWGWEFSSVADPDPVGSGPFWSDQEPDPDPGPNKWPYLNFFSMFKSQRYFRNLCCLTFWFMKILFRAYFHQKNCLKKVGRKFIRVRIRIWNRIRTFSKFGSGQISSGSATLEFRTKKGENS